MKCVFFFFLFTPYGILVYVLKVCMMGKYHNVLYIGVKTAWDWGVTDSITIKELLGKLWEFA